MTTERELVRIIIDGKVVDVYHGGFKAFNAEGHKQYERPFTAEYCTVTATNDFCTYTGSSYNINKEEFIEQFKKAMEE